MITFSSRRILPALIVLSIIIYFSVVAFAATSVTWVDTVASVISGTTVSHADQPAEAPAYGRSRAILKNGHAGTFEYTLTTNSGYWTMGLNEGAQADDANKFEVSARFGGSSLAFYQGTEYKGEISGLLVGDIIKFEVGTDNSIRIYRNNQLIPNIYSATRSADLRAGYIINAFNSGSFTDARTTGFTSIPITNAGTDQVITNGEPLTLMGTASDDDGTISSTTWSLESGPAGSIITNPSSLMTNVNGYAAGGVYNFKLTVVDNEGNESSDTVSVTVVAAATSGLTIPSTGYVGEPVMVDARQSTNVSPTVADGSPSVVVSYGDGFNANILKSTHVYSIPGTYTISVAVKNAAGKVANTSKVITISQIPTAAGTDVIDMSDATDPTYYIPQASYSDWTGNKAKLQDAIDHMAALNTTEKRIVVPAGAEFVGTIVLTPPTGGNKYITIESSGLSSLTENKRVTRAASDESHLATIYSPRGTTEASALMTPWGVSAPSHHYRLRGIKFAKFDETYDTRDLVSLTNLDPPGAGVEYLPHHFIIDRCVFYGGEYSNPSKTRNGLRLEADYVSVLNSYFTGFKSSGEDALCIVATKMSRDGNLAVWNNYLNSTSESFIVGGGSTDLIYKATPTSCTPTSCTLSNVAHLEVGQQISFLIGGQRRSSGVTTVRSVETQTGVITYDPVPAAPDNGAADSAVWGEVPGGHEFRRNHLTKDTALFGSNPHGFFIKNLYETKYLQNGVVDGNLMENVWRGLGNQRGFAIVCTVSNGDGGPVETGGNNPFMIIENMQYSNNIVRHATGFLNMLAQYGAHAEGGLGNIIVRNNLAYDIGKSFDPIGGEHVPLIVYAGSNEEIGTIDGLYFDHNTIYAPIEHSSLLEFGHPPFNLITRFWFTNNVASHQEYGFHSTIGSSPTVILASNVGDPNKYLVAGNVIAGTYTPATGNGWPSLSQNRFSNANAALQFVDAGATVPNFRLAASSPGRKLALDGGEAGANITAVEAATAGVLSGAWPPNAPTNARFGGKHCIVTWQDNSNDETGFEIQLLIGTDSWSTVKTVGSNITSYLTEHTVCSGSKTNYMYRVRAINASGASAFSNIACPRCVYTEGGKYPQVTMTSPANGTTINSGDAIILTADATDEDGEGTLIKVEFFQNSIKLGEDDTAPYTFAWSNAPAGNYTLTAKVIDNMEMATTSTPVSVTVSQAGLSFTLQAEDFDAGNNGQAYVDFTAGDYGQTAYRNPPTDVDIEGCLDGSCGYWLSWINPGEFQKYTFNVVTPGLYAIQARVTTQDIGNYIGSGGTFHLEIDGVDKTGPITVPDTGGAWTTLWQPGVSLTTGLHTMRVVADTGSPVTGWVGKFDYFKFTLPAPVTLQAEDFDAGNNGQAYLDFTDGDYGGTGYRNPSTDVDVEGCPDSSCGYWASWVHPGEWLKYTFNVTAPASYNIEARVRTQDIGNYIGSGGTFHLEIDGVDKTGPITVPDTGGAWTTLARPNITLGAGPHVLRVIFDSGSPVTGWVGKFDYFKLVPITSMPGTP